MFDMHYDMLSVIYQCYLRNDYSYIEEWAKSYNEKNVSGLLANLYFMSDEEMKEELGEDYGKIDVVEMFRISTKLIQKYLPHTKVLYSIEGCDYIKDTEELEELYHLGLRNILLVWNCPNRYGSGNRGDYGLTESGREFLIKAIDLGISLDLSHMNPKTFDDTIDLVKEQRRLGKKVKVIASHSNCFELCHHKRNLTDEQILKLKEVDGIMGLVSYSYFTLDEDSQNLEDQYLEHIKHAVSLIGIDHVGVSSDDMTFGKVLFGEEYGDQVFDYTKIKEGLISLLQREFSDEEIEKILYKNVLEKLF